MDTDKPDLAAAAPELLHLIKAYIEQENRWENMDIGGQRSIDWMESMNARDAEILQQMRDAVAKIEAGSEKPGQEAAHNSADRHAVDARGSTHHLDN